MGFRRDLSGEWEVCLADGTRTRAKLPGTLDENRIGGRDLPEKQWGGEAAPAGAEKKTDGARPIHTRLTRVHTYTGPAVFTRRIVLPEAPGNGRMIISVERSRLLSLRVNGTDARLLQEGTLSTPWRFETGALAKGENELCFTADNSYPGWPAGAILYSSAATDETQTNWNGLLGEITLEEKPPAFLMDARLVCGSETETELQAELSVGREWAGKAAELRLQCDALAEREITLPLQLAEGIQKVRKRGIALRPDGVPWSLENPRLYEVELTLRAAGTRAGAEEELDEMRFRTGFRRFAPDGRGRLSLNGQRLFLRGETNCATWPETGHPPMSEAEWRDVIRRYQDYGVNCVRFHSHCPPEAAFAAADELGMLMQPELSQWDPEKAFESPEAYAYYRTELRAILRTYGRHPSFVMLTLGNELHCGETGLKRMGELVREAKALLPDRLYAWGSNAFYGARGCDAESDFYTSQNYGPFQMRAISAAQDPEHPERKARVRGYLNNVYPNGKTCYREGMEAMRAERAQPMFSFEVGQYEVLPDFHELPSFRGVTDPANYRLIRERAERHGLLPVWDRMTEASGELALMGYREEVEAVMRTPGMSGISLLALQDFPGQGTALVGMMNSHLEPKPFAFAKPERFRAFFRERLPLLEIEKYTYRSGETLRADLRAVNYGREDLRGTLILRLNDGQGNCLRQQEIRDFSAPAGEAEIVSAVEFALPETEVPVAAELNIRLEEKPEAFRNSLRIWIYPEELPVSPGAVLCADRLTDELLHQLEQGADVLLEPASEEENFPGGIRGQFTTDFWSVGTFPQQEGGMGLLIDSDHPLFRRFPTSFHTDYQWWLMAGQRSMLLPDERLADGILVRQMDSFSQLRSLAMLMELRVGRGRILISTMGLKQLPDKPEVLALRNAMLTYMQSGEFNPRASVSADGLRALLPGCADGPRQAGEA